MSLGASVGDVFCPSVVVARAGSWPAGLWGFRPDGCWLSGFLLSCAVISDGLTAVEVAGGVLSSGLWGESQVSFSCGSVSARSCGRGSASLWFSECPFFATRERLDVRSASLLSVMP